METVIDETNAPDDAAPSRPVKSDKNDREKSGAAVAQAKQDDVNITDWFSSLPSDYSYKIEIHRKSPKIWKNAQVGGHLATIEDFPDLESIKSQWGGGTFAIMARRPKENGKGFVYAGQRTIEIAGDPKLPDSQSGPSVPVVQAPVESEMLAKRAMDMTEKAIDQERRKAERLQEQLMEARQPSGIDPVLLEALMGPARETNRQLADQVARLQDQITSQMNKPKEDGTTNRLLEKFIEGDSARIMQMREVHEAELRTLKESAKEDVRRAEDRLQKLIDTTERAHERELQSLKSAYDQQLKMQELAFVSQVKNLENMLQFTREELSQTRTKMAELEAKKDKTVLDSMKEMAEVKELMEAFGGDKDDEEPVWKQAIGAISESPLGQAMAAKLAGGAPAGQAGGAMPPGAPPVTREQAQAIARARAVRAAQQQGRLPPPPAPGMVPVHVNPGEVAIAVQFLETALSNGTAPEVFVQSARSSVPSGILTAIKVMGIDQFMAQFVRLDDNSNLMTVQGRTFLRKVAKLLVGDTIEEKPAPAPAPVEEPAAEPTAE